MALEKVLSAPREVGRFGRFLLVQVKLWRYCVRLLRQNRCGQQAAALTYHTIFGIVPLAIVTFMAFQWLGAFEKVAVDLKGFLYEQAYLNIEYAAEETEQTITLAQKIDEVASGFYEKIDKGSLTIINGLIAIWAAIALLSTIENAFNRIWHVVRGRNFVRKVINYWALLTLVPLLVGAGLYAGTIYKVTHGLKVGVMVYLGPAMPYIVAMVAFFLLYFLMPNAKVKTLPALWGALVAAVAWNLAKILFGTYVTKFIPYSQVYGVVGLIPLSVLWIYISWIIVLFGLQVAFTTQHLKSIDKAEMASARKREEYFLADDFAVINIVAEICRAFREKEAPASIESVCTKFELPGEFGEKILEHLVAHRLLIRTSEPAVGFVPATEPANITLADITEAVAKAGFAQKTSETNSQMEKIIQSQQDSLKQHTVEDLLKTAGIQPQSTD